MATIDIQKLYIAYFNRPADSAGLAYWESALGKGATLADIGAAFARSREYQGAFLQMNPAEIVATIYQNLFGRQPEPAGLTFWSTLLQDGVLSVDAIVRDIAQGARGSDLASFNAKVGFAQVFTRAIDTPDEVRDYNLSVVALAAKSLIGSLHTEAEALAATARIDAIVTEFTGLAGSYRLTSDIETLTGSPFNDIFHALDSGRLQSGDVIDGGAGALDTLNADVATAGIAALLLKLSGIEIVNLHATGGAPGVRAVTVNAAQAVDVRQWVSNAGEVDLLIENVAPAPHLVTRDVGIVMRDTAPGDVDFGVYVDSVRHTPRHANVLTLEVSNVIDAGTATPLLNSPFNGVSFNFNGALVSVASQAIDDAHTFEQLLAAFKATLAGIPALRHLVASAGPEFTYSDVSGQLFKGRGVVLTSYAGDVFDTRVSGAGWTTPGVALPGGYNASLSTVESGASALGAASIVIDGVGRGSTSGDLVVGVSAGNPSRPGTGIQRFDIEVGDNSRLQTIGSTNNALEHIVLRNGLTSDHVDGKADMVRDQGSLAVQGASAAAVAGSNSENLPGATAHALGVGLTDLRIIDASAMLGNFSFTAEVTQAALAKYGPGTAVGVPGYAYSGGAGNDSMQVTIARAIFAAPTATSGLRDLRFQIDGGAGADTITVRLSGPAAAPEGQLRITGGAGNDRIVLDADTASPSRDLLLYASHFGNDVVLNFNPAHDLLAFSGLGEAVGPSGTSVSLAHKSVKVAQQTAANDSAPEIAALYAGAEAGIHVYVAYDAKNVGAVYAVQNDAAGAMVATLVGTLDLGQTDWASLGASNFI